MVLEPDIRKKIGDITGLIEETRSIHITENGDYIIIHYRIGVGSGLGHLGTFVVFSHMHGHDLHIINEKELSRLKEVASEW
jgi:hypothetical protein